jgi:hypothetical protein
MRWVFVSWCVAFRFRTRNRNNEKTACPNQERRFLIGRGDFCCSGLSTRTSLEFSSSKPPWEFLQFLGRHPAAFEGLRNS